MRSIGVQKGCGHGWHSLAESSLVPSLLPALGRVALWVSEVCGSCLLGNFPIAPPSTVLTVEVRPQSKARICRAILSLSPGVHKCSAGRLQPTEPLIPGTHNCLLPLSVEWQPGHMRVLKPIPLPTDHLHDPFSCLQPVHPSPPLSLCTCRVSQDSEIMRGGACKAHCIPASW